MTLSSVYQILSSIRSSVMSSTGQRVPSHPELEVEWLPSSWAVASGVLTALPGCSCGAMLVDDGWVEAGTDGLSIAEAAEHSIMDCAKCSADHLMNAQCTFDAGQLFWKECTYNCISVLPPRKGA